MPAVSPLSTGLFDSHVRRARTLMAEGKADLAERELSEAYFMKPRDSSVLGLLGVLYFRQGRLERAEEVFGKLASATPEDSAILFNLGLINFKLNRFREAEAAFTQALTKAKDRARIHFYLAATYERHGRPREAIHQYRLARAAADGATAFRDHGSATQEFSRPSFLAGPPAVPDAPEFDAPEGDDGADTDEALFGASKLIQVPGAELQAANVAPVAEAPVPLQAEVLRLGAEEQDLFLGVGPPPKPPRVVLHRRDLLEVPFEGRIFFKRGALVRSTGHVTFWVKEARGRSTERLVIATGSGSVVLSSAPHGVGLLAADQGRKLWVAPERILACEETLQPRYTPMRGLERVVLELEGAGYAAVQWSGMPSCVRVHDDHPFEGPVSSVLAWSGRLESEIGLNPSTDEPSIFISGEGEVLFESAANGR